MKRTAKECRKNWENLRNHYRKIERQKLSTPRGKTDKRIKWTFFEAMGFLEHFIDIREKRSESSRRPKTEELESDEKAGNSAEPDVIQIDELTEVIPDSNPVTQVPDNESNDLSDLEDLVSEDSASELESSTSTDSDGSPFATRSSLPYGLPARRRRVDAQTIGLELIAKRLERLSQISVLPGSIRFGIDVSKSIDELDPSLQLFAKSKIYEVLFKIKAGILRPPDAV